MKLFLEFKKLLRAAMRHVEALSYVKGKMAQ